MPLPALLPRPRQVEAGSGTCSAVPRILRVHPEAAAYEPLRTLASAMRVRLRPDADLARHAATLGAGEPPTAPPHADGYAMRISSSGITLRGHDVRGLVWAMQTLRQILAQSVQPPCLEISDWPEYGIRYHHDDISRKQISTKADFQRILRHLASFKISHYTPYIEDMLQIDGLPLMGAGRGAFTPAELRVLVAEGARWQVEVFPTLSLAGHQENLMKLPRYRGLGARTWQPPSSFDARNPAVREHLLTVLDAACPLFDSPWFHMCFDEVLGLDADAFAEHLNWCCGELVKRGKTPLFWADMLYNHFGCDMLKRLHPAAIPVAWDYSRAAGAARAALPELLRHRDRAWVLAGYNNWGSFLHAPLHEAHEQWANWRRIADPARVTAFGASQWGDDGYENSRDLGWPLFAACAEQGWSGANGDPATVEARFHTVFHGHPLPGIAALRRLLESGLAISGRQAWNLHRLPATGWVRLARCGGLPTPRRLAADARALSGARRLLAAGRNEARLERSHLDHLGVAIDRYASIIARARAAYRPATIPGALQALAVARASYRAAWLAHNRSENIEVSLAVFDLQAASWQSLRRPAPRPVDGWHTLDLGRVWAGYASNVAGLPIGAAIIGGVPFRFAPIDRTHADVAPGNSLSLTLPAIAIADLHLAISQPRDGEEVKPGARLRLLRRGLVVYEEELLTIRHLCDWWAPLGEHMWAGGGFAYVDPLRVRYLFSPNPPYGITCIHRFPWPAAPVADRLELTCLGSTPLQVFALTLEEARR
jgi:hypothetical protein